MLTDFQSSFYPVLTPFNIPEPVALPITVAAYNDVRALQSYNVATTPSSQTVPTFFVPYAKASMFCGAMPTKFVRSAVAAGV